jgi:hypothetical protein
VIPGAARFIAFLLLLTLGVPGCGYSLVRYGGSLGDVRTVSIGTPRNVSFEPGIEYVVADALRREFLRRGATRLVDEPAQADLVLSGRVVTVATRARSFSSVVLTLEYEITLALDIVARRRDGSSVPLEFRALRESERYLASADIEATRKNRQEALHRISTVLAGRIHDSLRENLVQ